MAECQIAATCPFFQGKANKNTPSYPSTVSNWLRMQYCRGSFALCARHTVHEAMGQEYVPADLFPNEQIRAHQIVSKANRYKGGIRRVV